MAATTITRATLTDNVTVWNAAQVGTAIYDKVDALIAANITFGGLVSAEGFGTHALSTGGTGGNILLVRNTTSGTANFAQVRLGNDHAEGAGAINVLSSTWSTSGVNYANGMAVVASEPGGLSLAATDAAGEVRLFSGGTTARTTWSAGGIITHVAGLVLSGTSGVALTGSTTVTPTDSTFAIRVTSAAATPTVGAIADTTAGRVLVIVNASGADFALEHEYTGASAAARLYCGNSANITMKPNDVAWLWYDTTTARWRPVARGL